MAGTTPIGDKNAPSLRWHGPFPPVSAGDKNVPSPKIAALFPALFCSSFKRPHVLELDAMAWSHPEVLTTDY